MVGEYNAELLLGGLCACWRPTAPRRGDPAARSGQIAVAEGHAPAPSALAGAPSHAISRTRLRSSAGVASPSGR